MKTLKYTILPILLFSFLFSTLHSISYAADEAFTDGLSLVPCGNDMTDGKVDNPCDFNYLLVMINRLMTFILVYLAVPIAAIMFVYAGYLLLFSGGDTGKMKKAKGIFTDVVIGLVVVAAAWLIIKLVLMTLGYSGWNPFE